MRKMLFSFAAAAIAAAFICSAAQSGDKKNPATTPSPRMIPDPGWMKRHQGFVEIAKKGDVDLLFLGDSITDGWRGQKKIWDAAFGEYKPANFGIGGDRTQHVLWRIQNGELGGITPKVAVLMIGTNNTGADSAEEIAHGVTSIVKYLQQKSPKTKVLLLAVFPRGKMIPNPGNTKINEINKIIAKLDDNGKTVRFLDIGERFMKDGQIPKEIMPDFLHLSQQGYQIWADAITPALKEMLK